MAAQYVKDVTFGNNTPDSFVSLALNVQYIKALERFEKSHKEKKSEEETENSLSLPTTNDCLCPQEVCFILNQISMVCESSLCGC